MHFLKLCYIDRPYRNLILCFESFWIFFCSVSFDIDQANQKFNTFFEDVKKASVQLNDDDDKKIRYK